MSTSYYYLREPVVDLREQDGFLRGTLRDGERFSIKASPDVRDDLVWLFTDSGADDFQCPMRAHYGGDKVGCVVRENVRGLDPGLTLVSESSEIVTVAAVRALAGKGRRSEEG